MNEELVQILSGWIYLMLVLVCIGAVLLRRREASAALGWSLAIVFLPVLGMLLFLTLGINKVPRRLRKKMAHHQRFLAREGKRRSGHPARESWSALAPMLENMGEAPRRTGNRALILSDGVTAFQDMLQAIEQARHHVHIEFYIFRYDDLGRHILHLLERKCREGVEVRLIVDALGSLASWRILRRLRRASGEGASFLPIRIFGKRVTPHLRNHRKILICDGKVAYFGGLNIGMEYLGKKGRWLTQLSQRIPTVRAIPPSPPPGEPGPEEDGDEWADLHVRLAGPAVWDVQRIFAEDWDFCTGRSLSGEDYYPEFTEKSHPGAPVQIVSGGPDLDPNPVRKVFLAAFTRVRRRMIVATPYLAPDLALRDSLKIAALQGVEVNLLVPTPPADNFLVALCGEYYAEELVEAGVRIHCFRGGMMHAKAMVIDGEWALVGSANLDNRSMSLNFELVAIFDGEQEVKAIQDGLEEFLSHSTPVSEDWFRRRAWPRRLLAAAAHLLSPLI